MGNDIIERYKNETNENIIKQFGITFDEFQSLSVEELKKHDKKDQKSEVDLILNNFRDETNKIILGTYGITFDEFRELSVPDLINLFRNPKQNHKTKIK